MKPIDLSGLIAGLMIVISIAMALGKLDDLKHWAAKEAFGPTPKHRQVQLHLPRH